MTTTDTLIQQSLNKAQSYTEYRALVTRLLNEGMSTGPEQSEALTHYSSLNETRMNRLDKTITVPAEIAEKLNSLEQSYLFLVITEGWCGDAAQLLPVMNKMAEATDKITLKTVLRDENTELMDAYLTNGSRSIPKLIVLNADTLEPVASWGPRPAEAAKLVVDLKARYGAFTEEVKVALQKWYLHDKGISSMNEILALLK